MIKIPVFFHELLGKYQTKSSLFLIGIFVLISGALLATLGFDEWKNLSLVKQILTWVIFADISGGVVANLTPGTDRYYSLFPKKRWVFIIIHIQPIILSWSLEIPLSYGLILYGYTLVSASVLNFIRDAPLHHLFAGGLTGIGFLIIAYFSRTIPFIATAIFIFYVFKVLYSFSVHHHKGGISNEH